MRQLVIYWEEKDILPMNELADGARKSGYTPRILRLGDFNQKNSAPADCVALAGGVARYGYKNAHILETYRHIGVPVVVMEFSHLAENCCFLYLNQGTWLPPADCVASDRSKDFGFRARKKKRGDTILIAGQRPWLDRKLEPVIEKISKSSERKIHYRAHPDAKRLLPKIDYKMPGATSFSDEFDIDSAQTSLVEDLENAWCVITNTSNVAHSAMLRGIPVFCSRSAIFADIAYPIEGAEEKIETAKPPLNKTVNAYFDRLAYAHWRRDEIKSGDAFSYLRGLWVEKEKGSIPVITALTCTGGRQETFTQLEKYIERQTLPVAHWVIVDDCEPRTEISADSTDIHLIYPDKVWEQGQMSYAENFRQAISYIRENLPDTEYIAMFEDDDWYSMHHLSRLMDEMSQNWDNGVRLVGETYNVYYNLVHRVWRRVGAGLTATMATIMFHFDFIDDILGAIEGYNEMSLDLKIFKWGGVPKETYSIFKGDNVIGIKGISQPRNGFSHCHTSMDGVGPGYTNDPDLFDLKMFIGDDVDFYKKFAKATETKEDKPNILPAQPAKMSKSQRRYAKMRESMKRS